MEDNNLQLLKESGISENSIVALAQSLSKIEAYIPTKYVNDDSPDLDADNLNHAEQGIKRVTDALNLAIDTINSQSDTIAQLNSDLEASGIMPPSSGNGTINEYWGTGTVAYRIVNGICILYFDITLNQITIDGADICTNIPKSKMNIYQKFLISSGNAMIYVVNGGTQLKSNKVEAGQINGFLVYPII